MCYEFTRNGRLYYVYPNASEDKSFRIATLEEFVNYVDDDTEIYLLCPGDDDEKPLLPGKSITKGKAKKIARKMSNWVANIKNWIQWRCSRLVRNIGTSAKL